METTVGPDGAFSRERNPEGKPGREERPEYEFLEIRRTHMKGLLVEEDEMEL